VRAVGLVHPVGEEAPEQIVAPDAAEAVHQPPIRGSPPAHSYNSGGLSGSVRGGP
jgi:hypothetical protein